MKLRHRMLSTLALLAVPMIAGTTWARYRFEWRELERALLTFGEIEMIDRDGLERCRANPAEFLLPPGARPERPRGREGANRWEGPPRPPRQVNGPVPGRRPESKTRTNMLGMGASLRLHAYRADFLSDNPRSPPFPKELRAGLEAGADKTSGRLSRNQDLFAVGWRTPWSDGPAAVILISTARVPELFRGPMLGAIVALTCALLAAVWLAMGPLIGRTRKLATAVRRVEKLDDFEPIPEEGSDELTDLTRAFNAAGASLRQAVGTANQREASLRTFVENTAHDVGTPLTVLQGHLAQLAENGQSGEEVLRAMEEAQYIGAMLANLSTVARLEDVEMPLRQDKVDLKALCLRVLARHQTIASEKNIELEHALPQAEVTVLGEMTLLEQAVSNLVHNAVSHGQPGGHATLHLQLGPADSFQLRVLDDGPGIDSQTLQNLTARRWRSEDARRRHPNGRGLGLSIADDVAKRHDFDLKLSKSEAGGLEVTISGKCART